MVKCFQIFSFKANSTFRNLTGWLTVKQLSLLPTFEPYRRPLGTRRHLSMNKVDLVDMVDMVDMVNNMDIVNNMIMMNMQKTFGNL